MASVRRRRRHRTRIRRTASNQVQVRAILERLAFDISVFSVRHVGGIDDVHVEHESSDTITDMAQRLRAAAFLGMALLMTGCGDLLSLHPLYNEQERLFDAALEGTWENEDDVLRVERADDAYEVTIQPKKNASELMKFEARLTDIKGVRFADIINMDGIGHMFLKVGVSEGKLRIAFLDSKWLLARVAHEEAEVSSGQKQAVLTARTPQLRKLIEPFVLEPKAYDEGSTFQRPK